MATELVKKDTNENTASSMEESSNGKPNKKPTERKQKKKYRIRKFPIWLRIIVVLILFALSLVIGVMVGYGVIGEGVPTDALHKETWQHIIDIVNKD